jgi:hypothetical protein
MVLGAVAAWWWLTTPRAEAPAPPVTAPGARALGAAPAAEDITAQEKRELERILRERGAAGGQ